MLHAEFRHPISSRSVSSESSSASVIPSAHSESTTHKVHNRVEKGQTAPSQPGDYESSLSIPFSRPTRIRQRTTATRSPHNTLLERRVCDVRIHVDGRATHFFFPRAIYSSPKKRRCSELKKQNCDTQVRGSLYRVCDVRCHETNNSGLFFSSLQSMDTNVRAAPKQQQSMQASDAHAPIAADCVSLSRACRRSAETRAAVQPVVYDEAHAHAQYTTFSPML